MSRLLTIFLLVLSFIIVDIPFAKAQYFNQGQNRSSIKWKQINTLNFRIVYPKDFELQGQRVAHLLEKTYKYDGQSLNYSPSKIQVLLHPQSIQSNAFLGWAPSRIEMYATPSQRTYSQDWFEQLAVHEFRHTVQVDKINEEMPRILRYALGEHAAAIIAGAYLPFWFIEGDAVSAETGLTKSGRGREPDFLRESNAMLVEKGIYSYDKAYLGSYNDYVPNYYNLGYLMVSETRMKYKKFVWDSVVGFVAKHPFGLNSFDRALKKSVGLNKNQLYDTLMNEYRLKLIEKIDSYSIQEKCTQITSRKQIFTNYNSGSLLDDGSIIAVKQGINDISVFVSIDSAMNEQKLFTPGYPLDNLVSTTKNYIVWSEKIPDVRWEMSDNSVLKIYDLKTGKCISHKFNTKLFAPKLSPDNMKIIAVETNNLYQFSLVVIDRENGEIIQRYRSVENSYFITPSWSVDGKSIYTVALRNNKKGIIRIDLEKDEEQIVLPFMTCELFQPVAYNYKLYFIGGFTGVSNVYSIDLNNGKLYSVLSSKFGIADISLNDSCMLFSDYTSDGYQLKSLILADVSINEFVIDTTLNSYPAAENLSKQEGATIDFSPDTTTFLSTHYSKAAHLVRFHSWAPVYIDPINTTFSPGVSLMSQNLLNTTEMVLGYKYDLNEHEGKYLANISYMGLFPKLSCSFDYGKHNYSYHEISNYQDQNGNIVRSDTVLKSLSWKEKNTSVNLSLPLNFDRGKFYQRIIPRVNYQLSNQFSIIKGSSSSPSHLNQYVGVDFFGYQLLHAASKDVLPNWGCIINVNFQQSLNGNSSILSTENWLYLPGLFKTHGVKFYNGFQQKTENGTSFSDRISFPRGYGKIVNNEMYTFKGDYLLPVLYPDMNLGRIVYMKRVVLDLFYDRSQLKVPIVNNGRTSSRNYVFQSTGIELSTDVHFLRFIAPFNFGIRSSYLIEKKQFEFDFLFSISLNI